MNGRVRLVLAVFLWKIVGLIIDIFAGRTFGIVLIKAIALVIGGFIG